MFDIRSSYIPHADAHQICVSYNDKKNIHYCTFTLPSGMDELKDLCTVIEQAVNKVAGQVESSN